MAEVKGIEEEVRDEELDAEREAEREARRQLALAQIRQYPDSVLRMKAPPVEDFDEDLKRLATRLSELMKDANGVGLAATQVGVLRRVFVFAPSGSFRPIARKIARMAGAKIEVAQPFAASCS